MLLELPGLTMPGAAFGDTPTSTPQPMLPTVTLQIGESVSGIVRGNEPIKNYLLNLTYEKNISSNDVVVFFTADRRANVEASSQYRIILQDGSYGGGGGGGGGGGSDS